MNTEQINCDVAVIGAGPAGTTVAAYLAKANLNVKVYERDTFPRFRIGESLLPLNLPIFEELGIASQIDKKFIRKYGATFIDRHGAQSVRYPFSEGRNKSYPFSYQVERGEFDLLLANNAQKLGAEIYFGHKVISVAPQDERSRNIQVQSGTRKETIKCRFIVDASGHSGVLGSRLKLKIKSPLQHRSAFFAHFTNVQRDAGELGGDIRIVPLKFGWFWVIPFKGEATSVGVVVNDRFLKENRGSHAKLFWEAVAQTPYLKRILQDSDEKFPIRSVGNYSYGMSSYTGDGYILIGDSNAFLDPVFSSGVFLAMKGAQLGAKAVTECFEKTDFSEKSLRRYEKKMRDSQKMFLDMINGWYRPEFLDLFFTARNIFGVRKAIVTMLAADIFNNRYRWYLKLHIAFINFLSKVHKRGLRQRAGGRSLIQKLPV